ncbi:uncharacterized protein [Amphiura filiformis]|uniref:uncharacterized protein n=1 Tax=Amphiura filiformis TaxID=82378 RepID=UPI003B22828B
MAGIQPIPVAMQVVQSHTIQPQQLQVIEIQQQQQVSHQQKPVPTQLLYNAPQVDTQPLQIQHQPQQATVTFRPVKIAVINHKPPAKSKPKKRKKELTHHHHSGNSQQQTNSKKKRSLCSNTHGTEEIDSPETPAAKRSRKKTQRIRVVQPGMHSKAAQTQQSKEELMIELQKTVKAKLKEHVNSMETDQLKKALYRLAELQPGLVFDVVVGQLASKKREIEKRDAQPPETVNYSEIAMKRNGKGYIIQGHLYEGDKIDKKRGKIYLKCHKVKHGCKARARIMGNEAVILQKKHNHDLPNIIEMRFWNRAREEATKEEHRKKPISKIYNIVKEAFLAEAKDEEERERIEASIPQFKSLEAGMRMKKSQVFTAPANVSMLDTSFDTLRDGITGNDSGMQAVNNDNQDNRNMQSNTQGNIAGANSNSQDSSLEITFTPGFPQESHILASTASQHATLSNSNCQSNMQISNETPVAGNSAAVSSLLAISSHLQQL